MPDPIDVHLGRQVRLVRNTRKMTQEQLGDALGITFQQVQKYEKGTNRIGGSRLWSLSQILDVCPSFFFDGLGAEPTTETETMQAALAVASFASTREGTRLIRGFQAVGCLETRKALVDLIDTIARQGADNSQI